jgi:hypothetical protein
MGETIGTIKKVSAATRRLFKEQTTVSILGEMFLSGYRN